MINKALALIVIFSLAFNIAFVAIWGYSRVRSVAPRQPPERVRPQPTPPPAPGPAEGVWRQLGLTPEQASSVAEEWRQVGRQIEATQAEARAERARFIKLLQADALDEQAILASRGKIEGAQQKVRELVFERMLHLRQVLLPEQRRRWLEVMLRTSEAGGGAPGGVVAGGAKAPAPRGGQPPVQERGPRGATPGGWAPGRGPGG